MVQPRARRARRVVAPSSDDEGDENEDLHATTLKQTTLAPSGSQNVHATTISSQATTASNSSTPQSTPKKTKRAPSKPKSPEQQKNRTLHSFFNAATQRQQQSSVGVEQVNLASLKQWEEEDAIQDGISDDGAPAHRVSIPERSVRDIHLPKKRPSDGLDPHGLIYGSQKYRKRSDGTKEASIPPEIETDLRPWNEKYGPGDLNELVVHKKKVADVRHVLERALSGHKHSRLLVLKGAAGSGKTATLAMLAKPLHFGITEWRNPASADHSLDNFVSVAAQFEDFLRRGGKFGGLELVSSKSDKMEANETLGENGAASDQYDKQVLVIEEFPNNLTRATTALRGFRSSVIQYLEASGQNLAPLVMIISEAVITDSNSSADNFTAHRLLGPEILHHPSATVIEFNRVAPTFISKALNLTLEKRHTHDKRLYQPSEAALKRLSEFGDVRNAISTLEFLCTQSVDEAGTLRTFVPKTKSRSKKAKASEPPADDSKLAEEELSIISLRESSIGLFHAVGRVMYNKRQSPSDADNSQCNMAIDLPEHLSHLRRNLIPETDLDSLIDETGTDSSTFLSALHENYLLSCFSQDGNSETTLDHVINCLESLESADLLSPAQGIYTGPSSGASGLRQSELSFQVGVRGLLFNLPYPVKRQPPPGRSKADSYRMFYPASLKLWRKREETQSLADYFVDRAVRGSLQPHPQPSRQAPKFSSTSTHQPSSKFSFQPSDLADSREDKHPQPPSTSEEEDDDDDAEADAPPRTIVGSGHSARHEMLLERLPYMRCIFSPSHQKQSSTSGTTTNISSALLKQMDQITQFTGVGALGEDEDDDEDADAADAPASRVDSLQSRAGSGRGGSSGSGRRGTQAQAQQGTEEITGVEKLVLSDDDIEDD